MDYKEMAKKPGGPDLIEFNCMDCGIHVCVFGNWPGNLRCAQCQWLSEIEDEGDRLKLRTFFRLKGE
jgi:ribosomal protein S27E